MYLWRLAFLAHFLFISFVFVIAHPSTWSELSIRGIKETQNSVSFWSRGSPGLRDLLFTGGTIYDDIYDQLYEYETPYNELLSTDDEDQSLVKRVISPRQVEVFLTGIEYATNEARGELAHFEAMYGRDPKPKGTPGEETILSHMLVHHTANPKESLTLLGKGSKDWTKGIAELKAAGRTDEAERCEKALDAWIKMEKHLHSKIKLVTDQIQSQKAEASPVGSPTSKIRGGGGASSLRKSSFERSRSGGEGSSSKHGHGAAGS